MDKTFNYISHLLAMGNGQAWVNGMRNIMYLATVT